jgi:hypothetical protein
MLRAPGCCKPTTSALHHVDNESESLIMDEKTFHKIFAPNDIGYALWLQHLITGPVGDNVPVLVDMKPSNSYPCARSWNSTCKKDEISTINVSYYETIKYIRAMFQDNRRMIYQPVRHITSDEKTNLYHQITSLEINNAREIVLLDYIFLLEQHVRKCFWLFHVDEWLYHHHGEMEERTPSTKVFAGGF